MLGVQSHIDRRGPISHKGAGDLIVALVLFASLVIFGGMIETLRTAHEDVELRASREARGLLEASVSQMQRQLALWNLSLTLASDIVQEGRFGELDGRDRKSLLANLMAKVGLVGSLLVLDREGNIVLDPMSPERRTGNFADRDYFLVQRHADRGMYISRPYRSRLRNNDPSVALSRRLTTPDGNFDGVVMIAVSLASIRDMFDDLDPGLRGAIAVTSTAGRVLMRHPSLDGRGDIDLDLSESPNFQRVRQQGAGSFVAKAATDGIERQYLFTTLPEADLIISVGLSQNEVFSGWRRRVYITTAIMIAICSIALLVAFGLRQELARRAAAEAELARLARTDPLTGLANRRVFEEFAEREMRRAKRTNLPFSLIMIDADHFKAVNDRYGHFVGDIVLRMLANVMTRHLKRPGDLAVRYGGEEFMALLADTAADGAEVVANKIREDFERETSQAPELDGPVTVSIGVAGLTSRIASVSDLVAAADQALYRAKSSGRNRVVGAEVE